MRHVVPNGKILVLRTSRNGDGRKVHHGYRVIRGGEEYTNDLTGDCVLLNDSSETTVQYTDRFGHMTRKLIVRNAGGEPEVTDHPDEIERRRQFAGQQAQALCDMGFSPTVTNDIMHAAGPGHCLEAVKWAYRAFDDASSFLYGEDEKLDRGGLIDALDIFFGGLIGNKGFNKTRVMKAMQVLGLEPPPDTDLGALIRIVAGARVAIVAGLPPRTQVAEKETRQAAAQ